MSHRPSQRRKRAQAERQRTKAKMKKEEKKEKEHDILLREVRVVSRGKKKKRQKNGWFSPTGKLLSAGIFQRKIDRLHKKSGKEAAAQGRRNVRKEKRIIKEKEAKRNAAKKKRLAKRKRKANKEAKQKRKADKKHKAKQNTERDMGAGKWTEWTDDVQNILILMKLSSGDEFTLESVYRSEKILEFLHSDNNHIRASSRRQLQILRDYGIIQFIGRGIYKMN
jgi:hypothetical protein